MTNGLNLVLVESPTKSRTLQKFLGPKYRVEASMGHIRDLPKSELGVDVENNFEPKYIIPRDKRKKANELKKLALKADVIWLASDPDREGEAIAWHIKELIKENKNVEIKRVVFHEITPEAIKEAFNHPREIDFNLVDAQQGRRVLDRLVGYKLSPLLWEKIKRGLSAGRVQSVALRLIVEREREIQIFKAVEYWEIEAEVATADKKTFKALLIEQNGKKSEINSEDLAKEAVNFLEKAQYVVSKVTKREVRRNPYPPFITSTLQQAASNNFGFSAKKTMNLAQNLYEHGLITYMRTDSVNLASVAVDMARKYILAQFGANFMPQSPRVFKSKSKNAQEAHEAIRPTEVTKNLQNLGPNLELNKDHAKLYDLIWKRFVACQMSEAIMDQTTIDVTAKNNNENYLLRSTGSVIKFEGWLKVYGAQDEEEKEENEKGEGEKILPAVLEKDDLDLQQVLSSQHFTQPPPRYNEASLIKKLEELGIGRPSTYAPTLSTIQDRFYVERQQRKFLPTNLGFTVTDFLLKYFPDIIDYDFTAAMEDELDSVARGERQWRPTIKDFYGPFEKKILSTQEVAEKVKLEVEMSDRICPLCGKQLQVRVGKFGKFLACSGFPECKHTESIEEKVDAKCPEDGGDVVIRKTKKGKTFYGCKNWPTCKYASWTKPKESNSGQDAYHEGQKAMM